MGKYTVSYSRMDNTTTSISRNNNVVVLPTDRNMLIEYSKLLFNGTDGFIETRLISKAEKCVGRRFFKGTDEFLEEGILEVERLVARNITQPNINDWYNCFISTSTRKTNTNGQKTNLLQTKVNFAEFDNPDFDALEDHLQAISIRHRIPEPNLIVFSGHGYHIYYTHKTPINIDVANNYENLLKMEAINKALTKELSSDEVREDPVYDVTRCLRIPFTQNAKFPNEVVFSSIKKMEPAQTEFTDLLKLLDNKENEYIRNSKSVFIKAGDFKPYEVDSEKSRERIVSSCPTIKRFVNDPNDLSYHELRWLVTNLVFTGNGANELIHDICKERFGDDYRYWTTQSQIDSCIVPQSCKYLIDSGATRCEYYGKCRVSSPYHFAGAMVEHCGVIQEQPSEAPPENATQQASQEIPTPVDPNMPKLESMIDLYLEVFEPREDIISGMVTAGSNIMAGKPEAGKGLMLLGGGIAVSGGTKAYRKLDTTQRHVFYISMEEHRSLLNERLHFMCGSNPPPSNFHRVSDLKCVDDGGLKQLEAIVKAYRNPLICVDGIDYFTSDKRSTYDIYKNDLKIVQAFIDVVVSNGGTLWVTCHTNKGLFEDWRDRISGTRGKSAPFDTKTVLERDIKDPDKGILNIGSRTLASNQGLEFHLDRETLLWQFVREIGFKTTPTTDAVYCCVRKHNKTGITTAAIAEETGRRKTTISRAATQLCNQGCLRKEGGQKGRFFIGDAAYPDPRNL